MILQVRIGDVEISFDDDNDETPNPDYADRTLNIIRLHAINAWMAIPTILETDTELDAASKQPEPDVDCYTPDGE